MRGAPLRCAVEGDECEVGRADAEVARHLLERGELLALRVNVLLIHLRNQTKTDVVPSMKAIMRVCKSGSDGNRLGKVVSKRQRPRRTKTGMERSW